MVINRYRTVRFRLARGWTPNVVLLFKTDTTAWAFAALPAGAILVAGSDAMKVLSVSPAPWGGVSLRLKRFGLTGAAPA